MSRLSNMVRMEFFKRILMLAFVKVYFRKKNKTSFVVPKLLYFSGFFGVYCIFQ